MIVTAVRPRRRGRAVQLFIDGEFALEVGAELAREREMHPGRTLIPAELASLREAETRRRAQEAAARLLAFRPRSEKELRLRLYQKGFASGVVRVTIERLRELGLLDDAAFARFFAETQQAVRPRSRRQLEGELRSRGVPREAAEEATADLLDEELAYRAASRRLRQLAGLEYQVFRERLGSFLTRRGFSYEVARSTIDTCWAELASVAANTDG